MSERMLTRITEDKRLAFWCPGCEEAHAVPLDRWQWNGERGRPTIQPSILVTSGHYCPGGHSDTCWCTYNAEHVENPAPFKCRRCHTYVTNGEIIFLPDCTHAYAGKTVPLEAF